MAQPSKEYMTPKFELRVYEYEDGVRSYQVIKNFASPDDIVWNYPSLSAAYDGLRIFLYESEDKNDTTE